jgi:proline iminopeptidase
MNIAEWRFNRLLDIPAPDHEPSRSLGRGFMRLFFVAFLLALTAAAPPGASTGEHRVRTSDGVELWYRVAGVERGVPVLFLHGGPGEGSQSMQALGGPALEKRVRMVYLDQRGSGQSERPKDAKYYSLALLESDVDLIRRELGVEKIVLLAHSAGTPIALDYAADHPEHVAGLILTGAVPDLPAAMDALCGRLKATRPDLYPTAVRAAAPGRVCDPFAAFPNGKAQQAFNDDNMFPDDAVRQRVNWLDHIPSLANSGEMGGALFNQGILNFPLQPARTHHHAAAVHRRRQGLPDVAGAPAHACRQSEEWARDGLSERRPLHVRRRAGAFRYRCRRVRQRPGRKNPWLKWSSVEA